VRQADLELIETHLEPLRTAKDRHEATIGTLLESVRKMRAQIKDLKRDRGAHSTSIEQGLASIRSLLTRANRAAREQGIIEEETELDIPAPNPNVALTRDQIVRAARAKSEGSVL